MHSFRGIKYVSQAAQLRVAWKHDCYRVQHREQNILSISEMCGRIESALANLSDDRTIKWAKWYASSHAKQLNNNRLELERKGISIESVLTEIAGHTSSRDHPWTQKIRMKQERDFQKTVMARILLCERPDGPARIREILKNRQLFDIHKLLPRDISDRYKLAGPPAHIARRVIKTCFI